MNLNVMAESLAGYLDIVNERIEVQRTSAHALQSVSHYKEAVRELPNNQLEEVPEDVPTVGLTNLQPKQFNEEPQKCSFSYIYKP